MQALPESDIGPNTGRLQGDALVHAIITGVHVTTEVGVEQLEVPQLRRKPGLPCRKGASQFCGDLCLSKRRVTRRRMNSEGW